MNQPYRIFTWPVHQQYLFALAQGNFKFYVPAAQNASFKAQFSTLNNVEEVDPAEIKNLDFDLLLFQDEAGYQTKQFAVLSDQQRQLPKIYLEHHPPEQHPTNAKHLTENTGIQLVHVNHYNALMWDNIGLDVSVIENGVPENRISFSGEKQAGVMVLEEFPADERVTGMDIFRQVKEALPIDVIQIGKNGVSYQNLPKKLSSYRFLFCTDRYQSPQFSVFQAMMIGMPVIGLGTTALPAIIENEVSGFVSSDVNYLIGKIKILLNNPALAVQLGNNARETAVQNYTSHRFLADWNQLFARTIQKSTLATTI